MKIILKGKDNVYEQIVNEYKRFITLGILEKDEKLPSCRQLAMELGINPNTVVKAYNVLEKDGYIMIIPKKGVYVSFNGSDDKELELRKNEIKEYFNELKKYKLDYSFIKSILDETYGGEEND